MNRIWAPWRIQYILGPKDEGCFLCEAFAHGNDRERLVLQRGAACAVVMNKYPYNPGHLMICPFRHVDELSKLTEAENLELLRLTSAAVEQLRRAMNPAGFNLGLNLGQAAGAGLKDHLHLHIVPRWDGDTNFMPVFAEVKVIPQALEEVWDLLRPLFSP
jgi:ATP adenylyltransferase